MGLMSNLTVACLILGSMLSIGVLMSWRDDGSGSLYGWKNRFLRRTWPIWPIALVVGLIRWFLLGI